MAWGSVVSGALGAAASIAGGLLGAQSQREANANAAEINAQNYAYQKEFAQNGIRWKVADAKAAGLHPLAALGANGASYSPTATVGGPTDYSWLGDAGQSIGRAVEAGLSRKERAEMQLQREQATQLDLDTRRAQLENQNLQNQALKLDMVRQMAADAERAVVHQQLGPAFPDKDPLISGQGNAYYPGGETEKKPAEVTTSINGITQAGFNPDIAFDKTRNGGYVLRMSDSQKQANEDYITGTVGWFIRNLLPAVATDSLSAAPPRSALPDGGKTNQWTWTFNPWHQAYYPVRRTDYLGRYNRRFNPLY